MKLKLSEIKLNKHNPRDISKENLEKLKKSIQEFPEMLETRPLIIDENNVVLGGNMRLRALRELGFEEIKVKQVTNWSENQKKRFIISDNVSYGIWDWEMLANEWEVDLLSDWGLDIPDWEAEQELTAEEDDFEIPEQIKTDIVKSDVFEFRKNGGTLHRLMCGDSTSVDDVGKLMNGEKADMIFTDPPYGIKVVKSQMVGADFGIAKKGKYSEVIADDTTETANQFYQTCIALGFDNFIIWGGNYFTDFLPFSDGWLVWNKRAGTDIRNTFADGEMAWCSFHTPIRIYDQLWNGMIREREKDKRVHPTQKPIKILSEIIDDHVKGNLIFDGFLGSGSTMVASHQLNRKCYGMELDPKYCQVIVDRMKKLDPEIEVIKL